MENYLICGNPSCRFVVDMQETRKPLRRSLSFLSECTECGSPWSSSCPFCAQTLSVIWRGHHAVCAHCHRQFHRPAAA